MAKRLVLGTAQLGLPYGIRNHSGQPSECEAREIIAEAWRGGIIEFDTAQAYGNSEEALGKALADLGIQDQVRVISKLDPRWESDEVARLDVALASSLERLKVKKLSGFMLHHERQLDGWRQGIGDWLVLQRKRGLVGEIGVSVYTPAKAFEALNRTEISFVQVPANVLDRRFEMAGVFDLASRSGKKIYIRSIFLQGLLLMREDELPPAMMFAADALKSVGQVAQELGLTRQELAFGYVRTKWPQAAIVFGAETREQVEQNVGLDDKRLTDAACRMVERKFANTNERILNPALWA